MYLWFSLCFMWTGYKDRRGFAAPSLVARNSETETMSLHYYKASYFIHIEINQLIVHNTDFTPKSTFPFNRIIMTNSQ